jgi:altronate dehydratase
MTARGFVFMDTLGFDPVSATGQVAGGANFVRFTTGSVSVFRCKPSPSIKIATNTLRASVQKVSNTISVPQSSHPCRSALLFNHGN